MDKPRDAKKSFMSFSLSKRFRLLLIFLLIVIIFIVGIAAYTGNQAKKMFDPKYNPDISL